MYIIKRGYAARPFFDLYLGIHVRWFYPISAVLQELCVKGCMQENFYIVSSEPLFCASGQVICMSAIKTSGAPR